MHKSKSDAGATERFKELERPTAMLESDGVNSTTRPMLGNAEVAVFVLEVELWRRHRRFWWTTCLGPSPGASVLTSLISD